MGWRYLIHVGSAAHPLLPTIVHEPGSSKLRNLFPVEQTYLLTLEPLHYLAAVHWNRCVWSSLRTVGLRTILAISVSPPISVVLHRQPEVLEPSSCSSWKTGCTSAGVSYCCARLALLGVQLSVLRKARCIFRCWSLQALSDVADLFALRFTACVFYKVGIRQSFIGRGRMDAGAGHLIKDDSAWNDSSALTTN